MSGLIISRRDLLIAGAVLGLVGCASSSSETAGPTVSQTIGSVPTPTPGTPAPRVVAGDALFAPLERAFDARLGVWALSTGTGSRVEYRADERFAFCSTHKAFSVAAVLQTSSIAGLDDTVRFSADDVNRSGFSPIASQHVDAGMSWREVCDAAVRFSDNTAANLLFEKLGGPSGLQAFIRSLGDSVTDFSRIEPDLSAAVPGDPHDTTTPRVWGADLQKVVLGDVLPPDKRQLLVDWLVDNATGAGLIRAGAPAGWKVADRTGNGGYGTRDDIAVLWPPQSAPVVLVVMSSRSGKDDKVDDRLVANATTAALGALG